MLRQIVGIAAALAMLNFSPAAMADGEPSAPRQAPRAAPAQAAPQQNWTGGQFGGHAGGSQLGQSFAEPGSNLCPSSGGFLPGGLVASRSGCSETPFDFSSSSAGATFGASIGYRMQFGNWVAGVELDGSWKNITKTATLTTQEVVNNGFGPWLRNQTFTGKIEQKSDAALRARLGMLITPETLLYATAGLAIGEVCGAFSYQATVQDLPAPSVFLEGARGSSSWCNTRFGYTVGGGAEMIVGRGLKARLEYRFTDLGSFSTNTPLQGIPDPFGSPCGPAFNCSGNAITNNDVTFHTLRFGLGFDF